MKKAYMWIMGLFRGAIIYGLIVYMAIIVYKEPAIAIETKAIIVIAGGYALRKTLLTGLDNIMKAIINRIETGKEIELGFKEGENNENQKNTTN